MDISTIRTWGEQLYMEHERVCMLRGVRLGTVSFAIENLSTTLGYYDARAGCIGISLELIKKHCWSKVVEILKHEMAHQYVYEFKLDQTPHGTGFHQACHILDVANWARRAKITIQDIQLPTVLTEDNSIEARSLRKARKLLSLAQSSNENEANEAMKKAHALYEKYHLESLQQEKKPSYDAILIKHGKGRIERYQTLIANLLVRHFFVRVIHSFLYDAQYKKEFKVLELLGQRQHLEWAEYVYWFIYNNLPNLWKAHKKTSKACGIKARNCYFEGVIDGFNEQLSLAQKQRAKTAEPNPATTAALMTVENNRLDQFLGHRYPRLKNSRFRSNTEHDANYAAGVKHGNGLTIHKGVTRHSGSIQFLNE